MDYAYDECINSWLRAGEKFGNYNCLVNAQGTDCSTAYPVGCGDVIDGTTVGGSATYTSSCGSVSNTANPTAWYKFIGDGTPMQIQVMIRNTSTYDWDPNLRVLEGDSCGNLSCVAGSEYAYGFYLPRLTVNTDEGKTYYAVVGSNGTCLLYTSPSPRDA